MDGGAWWAAVYGVAQSRTRLKQLSSSSSSPLLSLIVFLKLKQKYDLKILLKRLSMHACIGEGNGNPLQCSCLENPRDGGAWWAAVYGVAQSRTRLK